jgi:hypothetical protein
MPRAYYAVLPLLLAVIIASAAMPASAHINLLQNPGFETGEFDPWEYSNAEIDSPGHTGEYAAYIVPEGEDAGYLDQFMARRTPQCAEYLEFWYRSAGEPGDGEAGIYYSDGTLGWWYLDPTEVGVWTLFHIDLDTTKLVEAVEIGAYPEEGEGTSDGPIDVDDFDLEACSAPVGGELMIPTPILSPVMLIAVMAAASVVALGYRFTRR